MEMSSITLDSVVVASDGISVADLDGEAVVLDVNSGHYFGLNEVGARVLKLSERPVSVEQIIKAILEDYDVGVDTLTADVIGFLREMEEAGLVEVKQGVDA